MLIYVAHEFGGRFSNLCRAKRIVRELQINDLENAYVCPLTNFSYLDYGELSREQEMDLRIDLLSVCDVLLVASDFSRSVQKEVEFAEKVGMEVRYLED